MCVLTCRFIGDLVSLSKFHTPSSLGPGPVTTDGHDCAAAEPAHPNYATYLSFAQGLLGVHTVSKLKPSRV